MTVAPDAALGSDLEFLTEAEQEHATALRRDSENAISLTEAGLAIGGAFLFYRLYMTKRLRREIRAGITAAQLAAAVEYHFRKFQPIWSFITIPAMVRAMLLGSPDRALPDEVIFALADDYAKRIGGYLNTTSKESLLEGFNAYINKRLNRVVAANRALDGFGLTKKQTRALAAKKDRPPVNSTRSVPIDRDRELYVEQAAFSRALTVGDNEAYAASQHGKQIGWMFLQREGRISSDAKRMWITARDERVCKACGPMHRKTAKIDEPFETPSGDVWAPSLHPNCRCTMALRGLVKSQFTLAKDLYGGELAEFNRKVRRDDDGKFTFKPKVKEREVDPQLEEILRQASKVKDAPEQFVAPERFVAPEQFNASEVFQAGEQFQASDAVAVAGEKFGPRGVTFPKFSAAQFVALEEKIELAAEKATIDPVFDLPNRPFTPRPTRGHVPLDEDIEFFDFEGGLWPSGEPMDLDKKVLVDEKSPFYSPEEQQREFIPVAYNNLAEQLTREVIARGHYKILGADGKKVPIRLSPRAIKHAIMAELSGHPDATAERDAAEMMGIRREAYTSNLYMLSSVYPDADDSNGWYSVPGPYRIEMTYPVPQTGFPVRQVRIVPLTKAEYEVWLATEGHQSD